MDLSETAVSMVCAVAESRRVCATLVTREDFARSTTAGQTVHAGDTVLAVPQISLACAMLGTKDLCAR